MKKILILTATFFLTINSWAQCSLDASYTWSIVGDDIEFYNTSSSSAAFHSYYWNVGGEISYDENPTFPLADLPEGFTACLYVNGSDDSLWMDSLALCYDDYCEYIYDSTWVDPDPMDSSMWDTTLVSVDPGPDPFDSTFFDTLDSLISSPYPADSVIVWITDYLDSILDSSGFVVPDDWFEAAEESKAQVLAGKESMGLDISLYPNPTTDFINISALNEEEFNTAQIYDSMGQLIYTEQQDWSTNQTRIDVQDLPPGTYILLVFNSENPEVSKSKHFIRK